MATNWTEQLWVLQFAGVMRSVAIGSLLFCFACSGDISGEIEEAPKDTGVVTVPADTGSPMDSSDAGETEDSGAITPPLDATVSMDAELGDQGMLMPDSGETTDAGFAADAMSLVDAGPVACIMNSDCAPSGWCRETPRGSSACTPWQVEGRTCGGFADPWDYERCEPSLRCLAREVFRPDASGVCVVMATAMELESDASRLDGHVLGLDRTALVMGPVNCTRRGCPATDMCCNDCTAPLLIGTSSSATTGVPVFSPRGNPYVCSGNECTDVANNRTLYSDNCDLPAGEYRLIGTFSEGPPPEFTARSTPAIYP